MVSTDNVYVCAGETHRAAITAGLPALRPENYLGEPVGRGTYAAIALSAAVVARRDPDAVLGVFTSDHVIRPLEEFRRIVARGYELAAGRPTAIVTFGVVPTWPATGYGYLELGDRGEGSEYRVSRFREKPDAETAEGMFRAGANRYLWNSGMFVFRAAALLEWIARRDPGTAEGLDRIADVWGERGAASALRGLYPTFREVSFDYAVMEPASRDPEVEVLAVPLALKWADIGSWPAYAELLEADAAGNRVVGKAALEDSADSVVVCQDASHVVALLGCRGLVVVHTRHATLVMPRERAEELKSLHARVMELHGDPDP